MAFYDIVMLLVVIGAIWFGYWKGLAWQVASLAAIIVSYIVAINFREPVSQFISAEAPWNRIAAMLILFLGSSLVIWTIYGMVSKSLKKMELKGFDRQAGALLGAGKGAILCMVITMFSVSLLGDKAHDAIHASKSGRYVVQGITKVSSIVPAELAQYIDPHVQNFHQQIGHDGTMPANQYPPQQNPFNNYGTNGQTVQNPGNVPAYQGQWQTPPAKQGNGYQYGNQQQQYQNGQQQQYQNGQFQNQAYQNGQNNWGGQAGYQQGQQNNQQQYNGQQYNQQFGQQQNGQQQNGQTNGNANNGWPDLNFQVNTKDVFDAAAEAAKQKAAEAAQRYFENGGQPR